MEGKLRGDVILGKFLVDSLKKKAKGETTDYSWILDQLKLSELNEVKMQRWLAALRRCISVIDDDKVLGATLVFPWVDCSPSLVRLYIDYLEDLVSAHTQFLQPVLSKLCVLLLSPDYSNNSIYMNIHEALQSILGLVPGSQACLVRVLESQAPYKSREAKYHECFVRNSLHITSYLPELRKDILKLIVLKMLQIDVDIPHHSLNDSSSDQVVSTGEDVQFDVDMDTGMISPTSNSVTHELRSQPSIDCSPVLLSEYSNHVQMTDAKAESIDVMMTLVFEYIHSTFCNSMTGKLHLQTAMDTYYLLLQTFEEQILLTHGSSHVQFLLFKVASYDDIIPTHFLDYLWGKFQDVNMASVVRQACALYMASFIARFKGVSLSTTKACLTAMMDWIHQYMGVASGRGLRPDVAKHGPFYSLCQAVFYIVVFKHKQIMESPNGHRFFMKLDFSRLILSRLNPLKVCLSTVVDKFASVTCKHEIVFCYAIIEQNKRLMLPATATSELDNSSAYEVSNLSTFFPFDPYYLARSGRFIADIYQVWEEEVLEEEGLFACNRQTTLPDQSPSSFGSLIFNLTTP